MPKADDKNAWELLVQEKLAQLKLDAYLERRMKMVRRCLIGRFNQPRIMERYINRKKEAQDEIVIPLHRHRS